MGMEHKISVPPDKVPSWTELADFCKGRHYPLQLRMIDGELAFPDEQPGPDWKELRVGTPGGMVTVRRQPDGVRVVTWGNADAALRQAWNALAWVVAHLCGAPVESAEGVRSADVFRQSVEMPF